MTLRSRLRRRLLIGVAGAIAGSGGLLSATAPAQAAYTPGVAQFDGTAGCAAAGVVVGCAQLGSPTAGQGLARDGDDLYLSVGDAAGNASGLFHYRRMEGGVELRSCVMQAPSAQSFDLGCDIVPLLPRYATRPAIAEDAIYVGGSYGTPSSTLTGGVATIRRDATTGVLLAADAACRTANATEAPACVAGVYDRLGSEVVDVAVAPDQSTVHALARTGPETQVVTYARGSQGALDDIACLANVDALCDRPASSERTLLNGASQLVIAPDGLDAYLASPLGLVHLARLESTGTLVYDDCVGDSEELAGLCDKGPGDFRGVSHLSMADDDQVIAIAYGDDSTSVVRLSRDGSGTLTEAGCIGTAEEDGCGLAAGVANPQLAAATPDGKNVVVAGAPGQPIVTLIAGGVTGLRPIPFGASGCSTTQTASPPSGCVADVRGAVTLGGPSTPQTSLLAQDDELIVMTHGSFQFFARGRAPGCVARSVTVARPSVALPLVCGDPNGDQIAYAIGRAPQHGTLGEISQNPSQVVFTPDDTYEGPDSFTYGAGDGTFTSAAVTYTLTLPSGPNTVKPMPKPDPGNGNGSGNDGAAGPGDGDDDGDRGAAAEPIADAGGRPAAPAPAGAPKSAPVAAGAIDLSATAKQLTVSSKRVVSFRLSCRGSAGAPACEGALRLAAASRLVVDGKRQVVTFGRKDYVIPAGATFTVSLRLPPKLAALVTKKKPVAATVLAIGTAPSSATPVQAKVSLRR